MRVLRAQALGMCFGVRDALAVARDEESPADVTIHGELVHNEGVLDELQKRGFHRTQGEAGGSTPLTHRVLITAHGISDRERARLENEGKTLIDTTCPLVRHLHEAARRLEDRGYWVVVIGQAKHVEVRGVVDDLERFTVVTRPEEAPTLEAERIGVVAQTTTPPRLAAAVVDAVRARNPTKEILWVPTVCRPTLDRQAAVLALLEEADALVVVGGRSSNNTIQLVELARSRGVPAFHVQGPGDIRPEWFRGIRIVGLTAGTSTRSEDVDEVHATLESLAPGVAPPRRRSAATHRGEPRTGGRSPLAGRVGG